jgi:hypothetical protein
MTAKILPFQRPNLVVFERFDVEDMAAMFRSRKGGDTYCFTLLQDGEAEDFYILREHDTIPSEGFTVEEKAHANRLVKEAFLVLKDQMTTWSNLNTGARLSLLIEWGEDQIMQIRDAIKVAVADDIDEYADEITLMLRDLENHSSYVSGLYTARSLL